MKKILILNYEFPPLGGGAGNATQHIARELVALGHQVTVLTTWFKDLPEDTHVDGYRLVRVKACRARTDRSNLFEMISFVFHAMRRATALVRAERPDTVMSFFAVPTGIVAWYLKQRFGVPYIISLRGGDVPGFLPEDLGTFHLLAAPATRIVWRNSAHIVANSTGLQELAQKTADRYGKKVLTIPNGVDANIFSPAPTLPDTFTILFVGRLTRQKGVIYILQALASIKASHKDVYQKMRCTIVGDGPLREVLETEARSLTIADHVSFRGWVERTELPSVFQSASVFVFPSFEEGMPNVILEAIASGLPVVATDIPGTNELVEHEKSGLLITKPEELPGALLRLHTNAEEYEQFARASRKMSLNHSWGAVAKSYSILL